jgi:hypothetical protein
MASSIMTAKTFEPSAISFGQVEKNSRGGKFIPLVDKNGTKTRVTVQFPTLHLPFGISAYREKPEDRPVSYSADLSFRGYESNEKIQTLHNKMDALDNHLIDAAYANSVVWFGKQKSRELLEDTYRKLTKVDASGKYAPILKTKIATTKDGNPNVLIYDADKTQITIEDVPRGSSVRVIAEIASVWQVGSTAWGVTFRASQIQVMEKPDKLSEFAFVDDGDATLSDSGKESESEGGDVDGDHMFDKFL